MSAWTARTRPCRVCGQVFTPVRIDAVTCSSTCRQRRHRGGDLAYLIGLSSREQRKQRQWHNAVAGEMPIHRKKMSARAKRRELNRQRRQERRAIETLGRAELEKW